MTEHVSSMVVPDTAEAVRVRIEGAEQPAPRGEDAAGYVAPPVPITQLIELWTKSPWLAATGKLIRDAIQAARLRLVPAVETPDEGQRARALEWLTRPSVAVDGITEMDLSELLAAMWLHEDQTGNVFLEVLRDAQGRVAGFALIPPQYVVFARDGDGWVLRMRTPWGDESTFVPFGRRERGSDMHEFLHRRRPNLLSSFWGVPDWLEARASVEVDAAHRDYLRRFFAHDTSPRRIIHITQDPAWVQTGAPMPGVEEVAAVERGIQAFMAANQGQASGRTLIVRYPGGVRVVDTPLAASAQDPTYRETAQVARDEILAVRRVSLVDLGLPEGGYRATAESQSRSFREQVLAPAGRSVLRPINRVLRAPEPVGLGVTDWMAELEFVRVEETLARIKAVVEGAGVPVLTPDEARQILGYQPVGDTRLWRPASWVAYEEG